MMDFQSDIDLRTEELVKLYGGVAYDYDCMPKVVAVHALRSDQEGNSGLSLPEYSEAINQEASHHNPNIGPSSKCFSMLIGIRNKSQVMEKPGSEKARVAFQGHMKELLGGKEGADYCQSSGFSVERLKPSEVGLHLSSDNAIWSKKPADSSLLTDKHVMSLGSTSTNHRFTSLPHLKKLVNVNWNWSNVGMAAENNDNPGSSNHFAPFRKKEDFQFYQAPTAPLSDYWLANRGSATENPLSRPQVGDTARFDVTQYGNVSAGLGNTDLVLKAKGQRDINAACQSNTFESKEPMNGTRLRPCQSPPRKRPRKSIPRKISVFKETLLEEESAAYSSTDSEKTLSCSTDNPSTDSEKTLSAEESPEYDRREPTNSPDIKSWPGSYAESSTSSARVAEATVDGWAASPQAAISEQQTRRCGYNGQMPKFCLITDRRIASLVRLTSLAQKGDNPISPSSLDREARIKELLSRREELLTQMRQKRPGNES